ncbi:DUF3126 family protein [Gimibacter soli]|uniref:DUF3126 family protein n=1 Tax=Gimibacter soli TaxID=3024400 RepID=A0AAF0BHH1_9PROT|nr:DUF3126 family protein [Gimibacter soli]WCL54268.1 DUF3126 family protein [Gimibacter soli]
MNAKETTRLQAYLRDLFQSDGIVLKRRPNVSDSVEVMLDDEFIGVVYRDEDEGEVSYQFQMAIIEEDLPEA